MGQEQGDLPGMPVRSASSDIGVGPSASADEAVRRLQPVDRTQVLLRTVVVEQLVADDHPARAIWAFRHFTRSPRARSHTIGA